MMIERAPAPLPFLLSTLALACGPTAEGDTGAGDGSGGSGTPSSSTDPGSGTAVVTTTTVASSDTTDSTGPADDTSTGDPASICDPQPVPGVVAWVLVDGGALPPDPVDEPYVYACTLASVEEGAALTTLELTCEDGPHTLQLGASVGIWFDPSGDFELSVLHSNSTFGSEDQLVTLRRADGELVLAGASSPWAPDDERLPADFFAPLAITLLPDVCPIEPPAPDDGGFVGPCFTVQRQALRFDREGEVVDVHEHGVDQLPPYIVLVQHAEQRYDIECTDTQGRWYSWVAVPPILD